MASSATDNGLWLAGAFGLFRAHRAAESYPVLRALVLAHAIQETRTECNGGSRGETDRVCRYDRS